MKIKCLIAIVIFMVIPSIKVSAKEVKNDDLIIIGVYECQPYYEVASDGTVSGYYHDLLMLLQKKYPFHYEYRIGDFSELLTELEEGNIDLMLGVSITSARLNEIIYNRDTIAIERFALYANDNKYIALSNVEEARIGLIEGSVTAQLVMDYFYNVGIDVAPIYVSNWTELEKQFEEGKLDIIPHSDNIEKEGYNKIYDFSGDQVYIAANKNNRAILDQLDDVIKQFRQQWKDPMDELYQQYFGTNRSITFKEWIALSILVTLLLFVLILNIVPKWKQKKVKDKIRLNLLNDKYILQYQPIYNPRTGRIVGFESLLRMLGEDNKLIPPYQFIHEIEENNMLFEVTLWILEKVIKDYQEMKYYACVKDKDFYLSVNVSLNEIEDKKFIAVARELLEKSQLGSNKICFEIIERIKTNNLSKVEKHLMLLKQGGFKIAIDDFGTEYSNLDLLFNLDTNIIKIDRCFVEGIHQDQVKNEVIRFISRIAEVKKKHIILEGVEKEEEANTIKDMEKDLIYVQGYYYNKPLFKEQIKSIHS